MFAEYELIDQSEQLSPGIVIAANKKDTLLRYGILRADGNVIVQLADSRTIDCSRFKISIMDWPSFVEDADSLFRCTESTEYSNSECLSRAEGALGDLLEGFYSILGDDFTYWCLTGNHVLPDSDIYGEHLIVSFDEFGVLKAKHHAIGIEYHGVIHFTDANQAEKTKPLSGLNIGFSQYDKFVDEFGVPFICPYKAESVGDRIIARNRAVNSLTLKGFGDYGLFTNNCEHFAIWCKTGAKDSAQVSDLIKNLSPVVIAGLMKKPHPVAVTSLNNIINRHVKNPFDAIKKLF